MVKAHFGSRTFIQKLKQISNTKQKTAISCYLTSECFK